MATIKDWVDNETKNGIELFSDQKIILGKKGTTLTRNTEKLRQISLGAISSNDSKEWYLVCRLNAPVGTILEDYDETYWVNKYNEVVSLCRLELTKSLMSERNMKSANILLKVLEKRDRNHWADTAKQISIDTKDTDKSININIIPV